MKDTKPVQLERIQHDRIDEHIKGRSKYASKAQFVRMAVDRQILEDLKEDKFFEVPAPNPMPEKVK